MRVFYFLYPGRSSEEGEDGGEERKGRGGSGRGGDEVWEKMKEEEEGTTGEG